MYAGDVDNMFWFLRLEWLLVLGTLDADETSGFDQLLLDDVGLIVIAFSWV